jgi:hypothetical protein
MEEQTRRTFVRRSAVSLTGLVWWAGVAQQAGAMPAATATEAGFTPRRQAVYAAFIDAVAANPSNNIPVTGSDAVAVFAEAYAEQPKATQAAVDAAIDALGAASGPKGPMRLTVDQRLDQLRSWTSADAPPSKPSAGEVPMPASFDAARTQLMDGVRKAHATNFTAGKMPQPPNLDGPPARLSAPPVPTRFRSPWLEQKLEESKKPAAPSPERLRSALVHAALLSVPVPAGWEEFGYHRTLPTLD